MTEIRPDQIIVEKTFRFVGEDGHERCNGFIQQQHIKSGAMFRMRSPESGVYDAVLVTEVTDIPSSSDKSLETKIRSHMVVIFDQIPIAVYERIVSGLVKEFQS